MIGKNASRITKVNNPQYHLYYMTRKKSSSAYHIMSTHETELYSQIN